MRRWRGCGKRLVLLPGVSRLARLVAAERDAATKRVWESLSGLLSSEQAVTLDGLLQVPAGCRVSVLEELRTGPRTLSGLGMVKALHRVSELAGLGVGGLDLGGVPARRVVELARYGMAAKAPALARHDVQRRRATLLATARRLQGRAVDDGLDLFEVLLSTQLLAHAEQESGKDKLRRYPRISRDAGRLAAAVGVLLEASEWGGPVSLERVWEAIEDVVPRSELRAAVEHIIDVAPPPDADPDGEWRQRLVTRYPSVRGFVPLLCEVIDFDATVEAAPMLPRCRRCLLCSRHGRACGCQLGFSTPGASMSRWCRPAGGSGWWDWPTDRRARWTEPGTCSVCWSSSTGT